MTTKLMTTNEKREIIQGVMAGTVDLKKLLRTQTIFALPANDGSGNWIVISALFGTKTLTKEQFEKFEL